MPASVVAFLSIAVAESYFAVAGRTGSAGTERHSAHLVQNRQAEEEERL